MGNDQYCLKWNSYEANLLTTFEGLLDSEALSDVTLFCEGESFKAHRLVLAACSAHFSKLFSNSTLNGQLIVILEGTHHQDLQILLQFMYKGVAYLHQDRIESVLRTAEVLQVKGLSDGGVDGINRNSRDGGSRPSPRAWTPPPQTVEAGMKRDIEPPLGPRSTSPKPSGRIAMPDSQLPQNSMPPPFFPSPYRFGLHRPESGGMKPSSTSATIFTGPMPGAGHVSRLTFRHLGHVTRAQDTTPNSVREGREKEKTTNHQTGARSLTCPNLQMATRGIDLLMAFRDPRPPISLTSSLAR